MYCLNANSASGSGSSLYSYGAGSVSIGVDGLETEQRITRIIVDCGLGEDSLKRIDLAKQIFKGEPFGQLQTLKMVVDDSQHDTLRLLTVPDLTSISLSRHKLPEDSLSWVAYCMPDMAPNITHLGISLGWTPNLEISRHSALKHLELRSGNVTPHFWQSLAACPLLMTIVLTACTDVLEWEGLGWRVGFVYLRALRTLRIQYVHPKVLLTLIPRSRMPMLECVGWDEYSRPGKDHVDLLLVAA